MLVQKSGDSVQEQPANPVFHFDRLIASGEPEYWVSHTRRLISFHYVPGFRHIPADAPGNHWKLILDLVDKGGYRVQ